MITDIIDTDIVKIMTLFSISPGSNFTRNEIKDKTKLHNVPLDAALSKLVANKILIKDKRLYSVNMEDTTILQLLRKEHLRLKELPLNVYSLIVEISSSLSEIRLINSVILFGSYAKLIYTDKSDVDLAVFFKKETPPSKKTVSKLIGKLEKKYNKSIELHFFNINDMKKKDPLIKEINRNGITLF